jgi:heme exporter protein A
LLAARTLQHKVPFAISFHKVEKRFGPFIALRGVSLEIQPGEFVALLGPNGAGKTTLLRIAGLLATPTRGKVRLTRADVSVTDHPGLMSVKNQVGMVAHSTLLYDELTAAENLNFFGQLYNLNDISGKVAAALPRCGLESRADSLVKTFSRGMRQRLAIARAILHEPRLLLLDEPAAGLDHQGLGWFETTLARLREDGCTIMMSTHARNESLDLATRAVSLANGQIERDTGSNGDPRPLIATLRKDA